MTIKVHLANVEEEKIAQELARISFSELRSVYVPTPAARQEAASSADTFSRIVALDDRQMVVGTLLYRVEEDRLHFRGLAVHPDQRRRGVARALVDFVFDQAARENLRAVSLFTVVETGNVQLFERLGFRVLRESPDDLSELAAGHGHPTLAYMERAVP